MKPFLCMLALVLAGLLASPVPARAGVADAPGADLEVSLVTYGPGETYWERFGHDAIELRDRVSGEAVNFNYGVFDFAEKNFLLNFARGHMHYMMDAEPTAEEVSYYVDVGRSVTRQRLALSADQAADLRNHLLWNLRPANAGYNYDYFDDNCATRVRDALDKALGGALKQQLGARPGGMTFRQQTDRLMAAQPWLMLVLDLGLSHYADQPLNAWQAGFLPMVLSREVATLRVDGGHGASHALVTSDTLLAKAKLTPPPSRPPDLRLPLLLVGAAWAILLWLSGRSRHRAARIVFGIGASVWLLAAGLAGLFMLAIWTLTTHHAGWANANLLLFNPLAWLLLVAVWRGQVSPRAHLMAWIVTALTALALIGNLTDLLTQRNLPWILLALPVWLALLHVLRHRTTASAPQT
jgi:hypothetical protein